MLNRVTQRLSLLLLWPAALHAGWALDECSPPQLGAQKVYESSVRAAPPTSEHYVPHPYPTSYDEVVRDFEFSYLRVWKETALERLDPQQRSFLNMLQDARRSYRVQRVEDWTHVRCSGTIGRPHYFLLMLTDARGQSVGRATVSASGHWGAVSLYPAETPRSEIAVLEAQIGPVQEHAARWRARVEATPEKAQWVHLYGSIRCPLTRPCLAFQAGKSTYLVHKETLYRLRTEGPVMSGRVVLDWTESPARAAAWQQVLPGQREMVSVGFEQVVWADRVEP